MTCSICIEYGQKAKSGKLKNKLLFLTGCSNFRLTTITDHEKSKTHIQAQGKMKAVTMPGESVAKKTLISLHTSQRKYLEYKFRNIHSIVKNNRPISDYKMLNELDKVKAFDHSETYNNQKAATMFLNKIAEVEREKMSELLMKAHFFSISMDGSTYDGSIEQESIFIRMSIQGVLINRFMCMGEPVSTCSQDLYHFVVRQFDKHGESLLDKCVGLGSDGASDMTGKKAGLIALMRQTNEEIVGVHCLAHRLELAFKDTVRKNKQYESLSTLLLGLFYFYKRSAKQRKGLKETFKVLEIQGTLPHRISGTRWLPHMQRALESLFKSFPGYLSHLQNASHENPKAQGLAKLLQSYQIMLFAVVLYDIIKPLVRLSLTLQNPDIFLGDVHLMVESTRDILQTYRVQNSQRVMDIVEKKSFAGYNLTQNGPPAGAEQLSETVVKGVLHALSSRFSDLSSDFSCTQIASFKNWPKEHSNEFGNEHVRELTCKFSNTLRKQSVEVDGDHMMDEWVLMKTLIYKKYGSNLATLNWADVYSSLSPFDLRNILSLIDLVRSLPTTSVINERSFHQLKLTKTDRRHRLSEQQLNDCLLIRLESPLPEEFDPIPAIEKWMVSPTGQSSRMDYKSF